jgi:hypothetical protein
MARRSFGLRQRAVADEARGRVSSAFVLFAETLHIALRHRRQALARKRAGFGSIYDVFERTRDEHLADARTSRGHTCHLIQHGEATVYLVAGNAVQLDGSSQVLAEAGVEEVIVVPDLKTGFGKEVGEILLEVLVNALKTGSSIASGGPARRGAGRVCAFLDH